MARYIFTHAGCRLAATVFAVLGGLWCLGALMSGRGTTLLVVGMLNFAASMLFMSLRPLRECSRDVIAECEQCSRGTQTVGVSIHRIDIDGRTAGPLGRDPDEAIRDDGSRDDRGLDEIDRKLELTTAPGVTPRRERKSRTWSI